LYVDNLIRDNKWLYKVDYRNSKANYYVLSCMEGPTCEYKMKISVNEIEKELPEDHYLLMVSDNVFGGIVHELTIFENSKPHANHRPRDEVEKDFERRKKGLSKFAILLIEKLELYLKKQIERISTLKTFLGNNYEKHVPTNTSLSDACYTMKESKIGKQFDNTIGDFIDLSQKYTLEKVKRDSDLFILELNNDREAFVAVFSCKHFLEHADLQAKAGQPSFLCIDATFNLVRGHFKLIVIGKSFYKNIKLIIIGTEAPNHAFRHISFALCLHENTESYEFALKATTKYLLRHLNLDYKPKFSMSDAHLGGMKALSSVFPDIVKLRCRFHLDQNIERKLRALKLKNHIGYVRWVISSLAETKSKEEFLSLWRILEPEILSITNNESFNKYLNDEIINSESLWFNGASFIGKQKCNNSLEGMNRYLKSNWTRDESKSVPEFFVVMEKAMDYYVNKCREETCMSNECGKLRQLYKKSQAIIESNTIYEYDDRTFVFIRIPSRFKKKKAAHKAEIEQRVAKVAERISFCKENYSQRFSNIVYFTKIVDFFRFYDTVKKICSCNSFMKIGICKHMLASEIKLGRIKDPYQERVAEGANVGRPRNLQL